MLLHSSHTQSPPCRHDSPPTSRILKLHQKHQLAVRYNSRRALVKERPHILYRHAHACVKMRVHEKWHVHSHPVNIRTAFNNLHLILRLFKILLCGKVKITRVVFTQRKAIDKVGIAWTFSRTTAAQCILVNFEEESVSCNGLIVI
jgi:hypothetical protein